MKNTIIPVIGTQTSSTSSWTGNIDLPSLYDGLTIAYFLPYNSVSGTSVSLTLTLNDGNQTDPIACYISNGRLGTQYTKGSNIIMTYWSKGSINIDGTVTTNNRWIAHADYNTDVDTDTWRNIKVNGTEVLGTGTGTGALDFINGTNTIVSYNNGVKIDATDEKVKQISSTTNAAYRILFSNSANDDTEINQIKKSSKLQFNPSNCTLTFYNETTTSDDIPITFDFDIKDTETGKTYSTNAYMKWYQDHGTTTSGLNMVIQSGGGMFLGGGEAPNKHYLAKTTDNTDPNNPVHRNYTNEETFITSDSSIHIQSNAGTITNRKGLQINNNLQLVPEQEDVATNNIGSIGTSSYRWANGYFTNINGVAVGDNPSFTDTWTALTGATSSANGSVGYINTVPPKNGYNTKFFRADGSWAIPANTTYTFATGDNNGQIKVTPSGGSAQNINVKGLGDRAFDSTEYLPLTGGIVTGTINIKSSNLDRDGEAPTDDQTGKSLYFLDKDNNGVGRIYTVQRKTNNKKDLFITVYNASGTSNSIGIRILDDGTKSYYLSDPSAFRDALSVSLSNGTITIGENSITPLTSHQSVTDNNPTLSWGAKSKVATIGSTEINVTMPSNPNTNTWRNIKVNGTEKLGTETGTGALNFKDGINTTVTYDSGIQINATDTKVIQSNAVNSGVKPLIMENNAYVLTETSGSNKNIETDYDSTDTTGRVYRTNNIYASPASGRLYLSSTSTPQMYLKYRTLDYTTANNNLSAAQYVGYRILDKNSNVVSMFHLEATTTGLIKTIMRATNYNITTSSTTTGYIGVQVDKNSNVEYLVSHKDKFREAIECIGYKDEEARLRATVGHSCKNLLPITLESGKYTSGGADLTYTVDKAAGTITINGSSRTDTSAINLTLYDDISGTLMSGNLYASGGSTHCGIRAYDHDSSFENKWCRKWDGETTASPSMGEHDSQECQVIAGHHIAYRIRIAAKQTINNEVIKPMFRDGSIIDDTFDPYQTPTDEAKQDKLQEDIFSPSPSDIIISGISNISYFIVNITDNGVTDDGNGNLIFGGSEHIYSVFVSISLLDLNTSKYFSYLNNKYISVSYANNDSLYISTNDNNYELKSIVYFNK